MPTELARFYNHPAYEDQHIPSSLTVSLYDILKHDSTGRGHSLGDCAELACSLPGCEKHGCSIASTLNARASISSQVLDARDPLGTRSRFLEHHLRNNAKHKHMILLLNKCDLVRGGCLW